MTIHVEVKWPAIARTGVAIQFVTTNTEYPGEEEQFVRVFADGTTGQEVKDAIDAAVKLYWQARATAGWDV